MNVGIYRGMIGQKNTIPVLLWRPQHWGQDFAKYSGKGEGDAGRLHLRLGAVPAVLSPPPRCRPTSRNMT